MAARDGASLSSEAIDILRDGLKARQKSAVRQGKSAWDVRRPLFYDENDLEAGEEFAKIMDEIEAERKRDFGRPVPDSNDRSLMPTCFQNFRRRLRMGMSRFGLAALALKTCFFVRLS